MRWRDPQPRNWLGGETPFPLNPSFKPPPPISDKLRDLIYSQYMADPEANSVRVLAARHHLSIKRVDAILRLKGMEEHWIKEKPIQTGFVHGMEELLGVTQPTSSEQNIHRPDERYDVGEADAQNELEGSDWARQRYQRMFWESVPEGKEAIMPTIMEKARSDIQAAIKAERDAKSHPSIVPLFNAKDHQKVKVVAPRPGRPAIKFIDVGGSFVDMDDRRKRLQEGERRTLRKAKKKVAAEQWRSVT
ncbi:eukaryotic mitochondrial regulator protein-domain-containing protein [Hygrophoropsis aurantiaca]|uniref:Eukaryotic mitochondrial regulator protein-domain-containing protein n=1 Tax=Hygrophoropsis aurantiaca TaxID=72124 RepID=A0ACB8AQ64_9AGAM|nr:eukaryotic mitochondrial regulator protein-domain-containing protein [Hygrophoropsis aurantiaca]